MTQEKRARVFAAFTVAAVTLLFVLIAVLVYQITQIAGLGNYRNQLKEDIKTKYEQIQNAENKLEEYQSEEWLKNSAYELGFIPGDN